MVKPKFAQQTRILFIETIPSKQHFLVTYCIASLNPSILLQRNYKTHISRTRIDYKPVWDRKQTPQQIIQNWKSNLRSAVAAIEQSAHVFLKQLTPNASRSFVPSLDRLQMHQPPQAGKNVNCILAGLLSGCWLNDLSCDCAILQDF